MNVNLKHFQNTIFQDALDPSIHTQVIVASRQTGKSFILRLLTLVWSSAPGSKICYVCPDYRLANKFFTELSSSLVNAKGVKCTSTNLIIKFPNGSRIEFFSSGSGDRIRGNTYDYVVIDECAFIREMTPDNQSIFNDIILPTLDEAKSKGFGKLVLVSTPHGTTNYFYDQYIKALQGTPGYSLVVHPVTEDEARSPEWCEDKKNSIPFNTWRQEYCCEFLSSGYSFFSDVYSDNFTNDDQWLDPYSQLVVGIDPSAGGGDFCVVSVVDQSLNCVQYRLNVPRKDVMYMALLCAKTLEPYLNRVKVVYVESQNPACFEQLIQQNVKSCYKHLFKPRKWSNATKYADMENLNSYLRDMKFEASNQQLKVELDNFVVLKTNGKQLILGNSSPNIHDDSVCSLAHCMRAFVDFASKLRNMLVG